jgi:uncharacterized protein YprB with RNaseH-like and TPR domain
VPGSAVAPEPNAGASSRQAEAPRRLEPAAGHIERTLGGVWRDRCFIVEHRWDPSARHGRETIGSIAGRLADSAGEAGLFAAGSPRAPFVFFDLETTGLSGGAGTQAFLVGCGSFEDGGAFVTRQFLLTRHADERLLLGTVSSALASAGALVSFNGKSFDAPVLETRYLFHRLDWVGAGMPHVDVLHPARRFWGTDRGRASQGRQDRDPENVVLHLEPNCSLGALERRVVGARRAGDVPGFEIPARYFQFVRSGDPRPLVAVLEHNRLDLLTLAALTGRLLHLSRVGPGEARDASEALALGRMYARGGLEDRARESLVRSIEMSRAPRGAFDPIRIEGLRALALAWRRVRQYDEAAACWQQLVDTRGCPPIVAREATEALAIHHEHRVHDLAAARTFALRSLEAAARPAFTQATQYRLARIDRKIGRLREPASQRFL